MKKILCEGGFLCKFIYVISVQLFSHEIDSFMRFVSLFLCLQSLYGSIMNMHKGAVSWDFWPFFVVKKIWPGHLGPKWTGKNGFENFFYFHKDIRLQSLKIVCPHSHSLHGHAIFLYTEMFIIFKLLLHCIACGYAPKKLFLSDCSFKICQKPSKFSYSVCVVLSNGPCQHSR